MIGGFYNYLFWKGRWSSFAHMACDFRETINTASMWVQNNI